MPKKKLTNVKSKKKVRVPKEDDAAYTNRAAIEDEDDDELDIDDEVDEVGLEKNNEDEDDF